MERPSLWLMLVVILLGLLFLQQPRLRRWDEIFLHWLVKNSVLPNKQAPLTIVEIGAPDSQKRRAEAESSEAFLRSGGSANSPLESALFLQAALDFKPAVIAFEQVLQWPEQAKEQEQIFVDQAMRVPDLLLAAELTPTSDPDAPVAEIPAFPHVTGKRGNLVEFSAIARQPSEDVRLISKLGFVNLPAEVADEAHAPLLFQYRGEVIPSFALEAVLLWLRITHEEVKIDIGNSIELPQGRKIPIEADGTVVINRNAANLARRVTSNELLLAAQQRAQGRTNAGFDDLANQVLLARASGERGDRTDLFAATIATIQTNSFVRRASWIFDCAMLLIIAAFSGTMRKFARIDLILIAIAFSAAYCLIALGILSRWSIWLPGALPLGALWIAVLVGLILPRRPQAAQAADVVASPPVP
jgi:CHASE2 domain